MSAHGSSRPLACIACGGTGGHLFPGMAVGEELMRRGCDVLLMVSPKEVDQQAVRNAQGMEVTTLPAVGLGRGRLIQFCNGFRKSLVQSRKLLQRRPAQAVLGMGGFTSAPPVLAAKACGAATFLHESNTIPGRANRWLSHVVHQAFVGFPSAAGRLHHTNVLSTGTPVRPQFQPSDAQSSRMALGLKADKPVLLIMGGSQGATGINELALQALPILGNGFPDLQFLHLTGAEDLERVQAEYAKQHRVKAVVRPFLSEMEMALGAATIAISRAGASSLAELAAMRVPAILIPYPAATDNHQFYNARALTDAGAAWLLDQASATGEKLAAMASNLLRDDNARQMMSEELIRWHSPQAASLIAEKMFSLMTAMGLCRPADSDAHDASEPVNDSRAVLA
ncbi:MAG: undecaprenyldiphospho-muramoylpentapeptide beta-N-acetylglucosaminyltransferase [Verrucomicrobia subdivision 3 bacterium]|nr:undecaprenyldiphospho-muramoylpentapeptide beta-N-acetylglucosaminyltransferase [Limisphaerales bacterium]